MSISKISNNATDIVSKTQKFSPKKIINTISEHKSTATLGTITAGLVGLAIYSAAFINHPTNTKVELDIAEANKKNNTEQNISTDVKKLEFENKLSEKEDNLKTAQLELKKDEEQINCLEKMLNIEGLVNREYYEQQYNILKDFIKMDNKKIAQCEQEYNSLLNSSYNQVTQ